MWDRCTTFLIYMLCVCVNNIWRSVCVVIVHLLYHLFMAAISLPLCPPELLLPPLFTRSLTPSIPVHFLGEPRPFCPPLSSSVVALILSSFTSLCLFTSLLYSAVTALPCVIKACLFFIYPSLHLPEESQFLSFLLPSSPCTFPFPLTQTWACCGRCTHWMSREHICVCTV